MDGAMGPEEEVVEAVLTCEGDFHDPELHNRIERFRHRLKDLLLTEKRKLQVKKIEPWNSVKVTFTIPREAALRLQQLAQTGSDALRQIGVLSVQIQGDSQISLTLAGRNNEPTQFVLRTPDAGGQTNSPGLPLGVVRSTAESGLASSDERGSSPGPSHDEVTKKNIVEYLRQGPPLRHNVLDSILGQGPAAASFGVGSGMPSSSTEAFSGPSPLTSNAAPPFRPNLVHMAGQKLKGSQTSNTNFPFSKTMGAFHPPVPRLPSSAGQSSSTTTSIHHMQSYSSAATVSASSMEMGQHHMEINANGLPGTMNNFGPGGPPRLSPIQLGSSLPAGGPSTSSPSNFMMDLPPPPPYPHSNSNVSSSKPGKPVTASSPLLVNLLQTDPLAVAAGMASGNPGKPLTAGDTGPPVKKKRRPKKTKDGIMKPVALTDAAASITNSNKPVAFPGVSPLGLPGVEDELNMGALPATSMAPRDPFAMDFFPSRAGAVPMNHIPESFISNIRPDNRVSFSSDRPLSESAVSKLSTTATLKSDLSARSAIAGGSRDSSNGGQDIDPFSSEIAAGKIINPYTGQLEPRDSVLDSGQLRLKGHSSHSQEESFATKKAKELEEANKKSVPISATPMLDVNVMRTFPSSSSVTVSTAAIISSGGPSQIQGERLVSSVPSHRRNLISDGSHSDPRDGPPQTSIYAASPALWQDVVGNSVKCTISLPSSLSNSLPQQVPPGIDAVSSKSLASNPVGINGPLSGAGILKHKPSNPQQASHDSPQGNIGPQGSVMFTNVASTSLSHRLVSTPTQLHPSPSISSGGDRLPSSSHQTSSPQVSSTPLTSSVPHQRLSSSSSSSQGVQLSERLKPTDSSHTFSNQQNQAASSEALGSSYAATSTSPNLLNNVPEKHMDSHSSTESPTDNKLSSEGDENSNHSVTNADNLPEHSGTNALLEHSGVKSENHDSGVGSSSERSDDTPSEPGDGEFRSAQAVGDSEETSTAKVSSQKSSDCKGDSKLDSSSTTITVGYMISPGDCSSHLKSPLAKDKNQAVKIPGPSSPSDLNRSDLSKFLDTHLKSVDKTELLSGSQRVSPAAWAAELSKQDHPNHVRPHNKQNGPMMEDLGNISPMKMNGPSSSIDKIIMDMNDLQQKKSLTFKRNMTKKDLQSEQSLQSEMIEKMTKLHQLGETSKESLEASAALRLSGLDGKAVSPDRLLQGLGENRGDQLSIYDVEELVNGKMMGSSNGGEGKGGSNITSIYSKRSSPVNVNMLNHIYAPGLPLPRRLTESVQRLVKPLPASESSVPHVRPCKSPGSGSSPRASSVSVNGQSSSRVSVQSGARSPGASIPKLIPNDKHSLLSERLDLAGLSSIHYGSTPQSSHQGSKAGDVPAHSAEAVLKDLHTSSLSFLSNSQHSPPNIFNSKPHQHSSSKLLSQSYPPHKSRDLSNSDSLSHLHPHIKGYEKKSISPTFMNSQYGLQSASDGAIRVSAELSSQVRSSPQNVTGMPPLYSMNSLSSASTASSHSSSVMGTVQRPVSHSSGNSADKLELHNSHSSSKSCSSPSMPVLNKQGLEPLPLLPPASSSQQANRLFLKESVHLSSSSSSHASPPVLSNSKVGNGSVTPTSHHVPYCAVSSGDVGRLSLSTVPASLSDKASTTSSSSQGKLSSTVPKLAKVFSSSSPTSPRAGILQNRNLFESVTGSFVHELGKDDSVAVSGSTQCTNSINLNEPVNSVLVSMDSESNLTVRNVRHKVRDLSPTSQKSSPMKGGQLGSESSSIMAVTTEVVNLDFSTSQLPSLNSLPSLPGKNDLLMSSIKQSKFNSSLLGLDLPQSLAVNSVSSSLVQTSSSSFDSVRKLSASVSSRCDVQSVSLSTSVPPVKEPILETLANTLESSSSKTTHINLISETSSTSVTTDNSKSNISGNESECTAASHRLQDSHKPSSQTSEELSSEAHSHASSTDGSERRVTRKRKSTHSEGDSNDAEGDESPVAKQPRTNLQSPAGKTATKHVESFPLKESVEDKGKSLISPSVSTPEASSEQPKVTSTAAQEGKDNFVKAVSKPHVPHASENSDSLSTKDSKTKSSESAESSDGSESLKEGRAHSAASNESKEGKPHRNTAPESKERSHRINATNVSGDEKESPTVLKDSSEPKEGTEREGSVKDSLKPRTVTTNSIQSKDSEEKISPQSNPKREDSGKDKISGHHGKAVVSQEKSNAENKAEGDSGKKHPRVKRQFYAYVPEKSIDQTYFDTPILTGRTRSKNKPADGEKQDNNGQSVTPQGPAATESGAGHHGESQQSPGLAKGEQAAAATVESGKRSTRSHKLKDVPQDQSASKRRRVNPREQR